MSDFKLCENGHYYPKSLDECPYCPKSGNDDDFGQFNKKDFNPDLPATGGGGLDKTMLDQGGGGFGGGGFGGGQEPDLFGKGGDFGGGGGLGRTQIFNPNDMGGSGFGGGLPTSSNFAGGGGFQPRTESYGRKLVGWLVSFTVDPNGVDYQLFEGRNSLGSKPGCDIVVNDPAVSGHHLTILFRMGHFKFKDELSTNGTFINDVFVEEGNLQDGDNIRIGDTIFKFRSIA